MQTGTATACYVISGWVDVATKNRFYPLNPKLHAWNSGLLKSNAKSFHNKNPPKTQSNRPRMKIKEGRKRMKETDRHGILDGDRAN